MGAYASQSALRLGFLGISEFGSDINLDDISLRTPVCEVQAGGLVIGNVYSGNTNTTLNDVAVSNDSGYSTISAATPDPAVNDGFFFLIHAGWNP